VRIRSWLPSLILPVIALTAWTYWSRQHESAPTTDYAFSYSRQVLKEDPHRLDSPTLTPRTFPIRIARMLVTRSLNATTMLLNTPGLSLRKAAPAMLLFLVLVSVGFASSLVQRGELLDWYVLLYSGILLLYPYDEGMRYLYPIQGFLMLYCLNGIELIYAAVAKALRPHAASPRSGLRPALAILFAALLVSGSYQVRILADRNANP